MTLSFELVCLVKIGPKPDCTSDGQVEGRSIANKETPQIEVSYNVSTDPRAEIIGDIATAGPKDEDSSAMEITLSITTSLLLGILLFF